MVVRMGYVALEIKYVVNLNDPDMVDHAKDSICEDIDNCVKHNETLGYIDIIEDATLTEQDILEFLRHDDEGD